MKVSNCDSPAYPQGQWECRLTSHTLVHRLRIDLGCRRQGILCTLESWLSLNNRACAGGGFPREAPCPVPSPPREPGTKEVPSRGNYRAHSGTFRPCVPGSWRKHEHTHAHARTHRSWKDLWHCPEEPLSRLIQDLDPIR